MLTLLGLEPTANPNEGEQEDWRQLTGFTGLGRRINEDEDGNRTTPRRTRLSVELHYAAFANMWYERGELDLDDDDIGNGQSPRAAGAGDGDGNTQGVYKEIRMR
eukprot:scaffold5195_cov152-Skeletonema_menzelii.AAC.2